jgi:hypothetical protein
MVVVSDSEGPHSRKPEEKESMIGSYLLFGRQVRYA